MLIGMCGAGLPDVRDFVARALPEAEIVVLDHGIAPDRAVDPLLAENVIVTPHIGGVTRESYAQMAAAFAASVRSFT